MEDDAEVMVHSSQIQRSEGACRQLAVLAAGRWPLQPSYGKLPARRPRSTINSVYFGKTVFAAMRQCLRVCTITCRN